MARNGQTGRRSRRKHDNWYYLDQLPSELRIALCHAAFTWDAKYFLDRWNSGRYSIPALVRIIKEADADKAAKALLQDVPGKFERKKVKTAYADPAYRVPVLYPAGLL